MIKSNVKICATISRAASVKEGKDNGPFVSFSVSLPVTGRDGSQKTFNISVSADGDQSNAAMYTEGVRVSIKGILTLRKRNDVVYFNLHAEDVEIVAITEEDKIEGDFHFMGKISKEGVKNLTDKKGKSFQSFSAFSSDRDGDNVEFIWVRFLNFHPSNEEFLKANAYVEVKGELQLGVYKEALSLDCRVKEIAPWDLQRNS